jgi:membrane protein implicated in regulation of membrane protease activity
MAGDTWRLRVVMLTVIAALALVAWLRWHAERHRREGESDKN